MSPHSVPGRVLVIDDSAAIRRMVTTLLTMMGHESITAANGAEGLQALTSDVDLVLLDLHLPDRHGLDLLREFRAAPARPVPVLVMSGSEDAGGVVRSIELGADDHLQKPLDPTLFRARVRTSIEASRARRRERAAFQRVNALRKRAFDLLESVVGIGALMSSTGQFERLLEEILLQAKSFCHADAGTLYRVTPDHELRFELMRTDSLGIALGGSTGNPISFAPLRLYDATTGEPNLRYVATYVALTGEAVNIRDAYEAEGFDFSGTRAFDQQTGYRSASFLTIPLKREDGQVLGVLQLINARDRETGEVEAFDAELERMVTALSRLASISLGAFLREKGLRRQIESLRIEVDTQRQARQVAEITETDYFARLQSRARTLRQGRVQSG